VTGLDPIDEPPSRTLAALVVSRSKQPPERLVHDTSEVAIFLTGGFAGARARRLRFAGMG